MRRAFEAALVAVDARRATADVLRARPVVGSAYVLALGKAALAMTAGVLETTSIEGGLVVAPLGGPELTMPPCIEVRRGAHPVPDADVARRGDAMLELAGRIPEHATAIVLISGGGSALIDAPAEGVSPDDLSALTRLLLASGATIGELNALRVALSRFKGGGLADALRCACRAIVVSDVPGDPTRVASGPVSPWRRPSPKEVLRRPHIVAALTPAERARIERWRPSRSRAIELEVAADNERAVTAAIEALAADGRRARRAAPLAGEARECGRAWAATTRIARVDAIVAGGETVVTVRGGGRGGRNQEMALAAMEAGLRGTLLCAGTDGIDGPTDAAGAIVDASARSRIDETEMRRALDDNDAYTALARADALLITGPTGTNVADLAIWAR